MPMVRAMRMLNAIEAGTLSSAQFQSLLTSDPGRLAEWNVLLGMRGQCQRAFASITASSALLGSAASLNALVNSLAGMRNVMEDPTAVHALIANNTALTKAAGSSVAVRALIASDVAIEIVSSDVSATVGFFSNYISNKAIIDSVSTSEKFIKNRDVCSAAFNLIPQARHYEWIKRWTWKQYSLPSTNYGYQAVTYGNGVFVAVARNSTVAATSPDGITWTQRTTPLQSYWEDAIYGGGVFVAVGKSPVGIICSSNSGASWSTCTVPSNISSNLSVTYGNGTFVATGAGAKAATSTNGYSWVERTMPQDKTWRSVTYGNGVFVAVAESSTVVATSPDGITWTQRTLPANVYWRSVTYGNGVFVAVANNSTVVATSPDGITWGYSPTSLPSSSTKWCKVIYGGGVFLSFVEDQAISSANI